LLQVCSEWGLSNEKIVAIVSDNAANIVKACVDTFGKNRHINCCAHTLNLVPDKVFKERDEISFLLEKMRRIVKWFKHSVVGSDELRKLQRDRGIAEGSCLKLIHDVSTRWNSTFYMVDRFIALSKDVSQILLSNSSSPQMLTALDMEIAKGLVELLKPLELVTRELSAEKFVTISKIIPIIHCMEIQVEKVNIICFKIKNPPPVELCWQTKRNP
jgi:hypothetical protein